MLRWLLSLLGFGQRPTQLRKDPRPSPPTPRQAPAEREEPEEPEEPKVSWLNEEAQAFLAELVKVRPPAELQDLPNDDRVFIAGLLKRIRSNQLAIPLLPRAAIEISRLLVNPNRNINDFVRTLETDPALSVDVLRVANSSFYAQAAPTQSVQNAIIRIGLNQIRGLIVTAHLHGKVLRAGSFQAEAGWLSNLSMALAHLAQELAAPLGLEANAAFTRGVLFHVEHFIIMGSAAEISREHQRRFAPTGRGLLEALRRVGPKVRETAARAWNLEELMVNLPGTKPARSQYVSLERALVTQWTGQDLPGNIEGISPARVAALAAQFAPRSKPAEAAQPA